MRNILLVIVFTLFIHFSFAQKLIGEATVTYNVSMQKKSDGNPVQSLTASYMLNLKGGMSRSDFSSTLGTESAIFNNKIQEGAIIKSYGAQKLLIKMNANDWEDRSSHFKNIPFSVEKETKVIMGVTCSKAVAQTSKGDLVTVYYDPETQCSNKDFSLAFTNINGLPMQIIRSGTDVTYEYTISKISYEIVPTATFTIPQTGFRVLDYSEAKKMGQWK